MKAYEPTHEEFVVPLLRNEAASKDFLSQGNATFKKGNLFEALESFNKSLCTSELNSKEIPLAFFGRSMVYLDAEEYEKCLDNIQLARSSGFPAEKLDTLNYLEAKCKKLMVSKVKTDDDDPWTFFKLSYPANEKIPFIVNCLELHNSTRFGRLLTATQDLHPGDIIAIDEPFYKSIQPQSEHLRCTNCLKSNKMSLIPSEITRTAMFCSQECMKTATSTFLQAENDSKMHDIKQRILFEALAICGGSFDKLKQLMEDPELSNKTIFDFDFSDVNDPNYKFNMMISVNSLAQIEVVKREIVKYMDRHPALDLFESREEKAIAKAFMIRAFRILTVNSFGVEWVIPAKSKDRDIESVNTKLAGDGLCAFGSLINHSCIPNIDRLFVGNKFVFYVRRPIKAGQQLFTCYGTLFADAPREQRQETLKQEYGFVCSCEACTLDYPTPYGYPWTDVPLIITERSSVIEWKRNFKENCKTIAESEGILTNLEMCKIMLRNLYYLVAIAKTEPFIF